MTATDLVRVFSVTTGDTVSAGVRQFVITTTLLAKPTECLQLQTINAFAASVCQRAKEKGRTVAVTWERTKFGPTLKSAHLLKAKDAA